MTCDLSLHSQLNSLLFDLPLVDLRVFVFCFVNFFVSWLNVQFLKFILKLKYNYRSFKCSSDVIVPVCFALIQLVTSNLVIYLGGVGAQ